MVPFIRKWIFAVALVSSDNVLIQFVLIFISNVVELYILVKMKPFKVAKVNTLKIVGETIFTTAFFLLTVYLSGKSQLSVQMYRAIGWIITYLIIAMLLIETAVLFMSKTKSEKSDKKPIDLKTPNQLDEDD